MGCYDLGSDSRLLLQGTGTDGENTGGTGGTTTVNPGCVPNQTGDAIDDACGVFVSASKGSDSNSGATKMQPVATLKKAIALANRHRPVDLEIRGAMAG